MKTREEIKAQIEEWKADGKKVGYTSGVFDLLHAGHVAYLREAANLCDELVIGLNSDSSVRQNKGDKRPIQAQQDRYEIISALSSVAGVFVFDERNNNVNIESLKPDVYIKAGDYSVDKLSSAPIVQAYGGEVKIVPDIAGRSSSSIVDTILERYAEEVPRFEPGEVKADFERAVFLDRDGTLIEHVEYIHEEEKVRLLPGVAAGLKRLKEAGFALVVTTNQSGIGVGYFTVEDFFKVNRRMLKMLFAEGASVDRVYFSQASGAQKSHMRKPAPGMVERAVKEFGVDPTTSFVIGDTSLDMKLAQNVGAKGVFVETGATKKADIKEVGPDFLAENFLAAVDWILAQG